MERANRVSHGTSTPCVSLLKPYRFGNPAAARRLARRRSWRALLREQETYRRKLVGKIVTAEFYVERDALEQSWIRMSRGRRGDGRAAPSCAREEAAFMQNMIRRRLNKRT
jgi:hypothetical protein